MDKNRKMTQHEKQIMGLFWSMEKQKATINELLSVFPDPKPAYTTLATFLRIMTQKGFVKYEKKQRYEELCFLSFHKQKRILETGNERNEEHLFRRLIQIVSVLLCEKRESE